MLFLLINLPNGSPTTNYFSPFNSGFFSGNCSFDVRNLRVKCHKSQLAAVALRGQFSVMDRHGVGVGVLGGGGGASPRYLVAGGREGSSIPLPLNLCDTLPYTVCRLHHEQQVRRDFYPHVPPTTPPPHISRILYVSLCTYNNINVLSAHIFFVYRTTTDDQLRATV